MAAGGGCCGCAGVVRAQVRAPGAAGEGVGWVGRALRDESLKGGRSDERGSVAEVRSGERKCARNGAGCGA